MLGGFVVQIPHGRDHGIGSGFDEGIDDISHLCLADRPDAGVAG
jgi:hypothetical protein